MMDARYEIVGIDYVRLGHWHRVAKKWKHSVNQAPLPPDTDIEK